MEKLLAFQDKIKNKMYETIRSDVEISISEKEREINEIKQDYDNQKCKKGFFLKKHIQDIKNSDMTIKELFSLYFNFVIVFSFCFTFIATVIYIATRIYINEVINEREIIEIKFFLLMFFSGIGIPGSLHFTSLQITGCFDLKTKLTIKYETLEEELVLLKAKLFNLEYDIDAYMNNDPSSDYKLNEDDVCDVAMTVLSKEELHEISKILTKEELIHLTIVAIEDSEEEIIQVLYCDILHFIDIKKKHNIEKVAGSVFNISEK